jgi:hypothetical protein
MSGRYASHALLDKAGRLKRSVLPVAITTSGWQQWRAITDEQTIAIPKLTQTILPQ